MSLYTVTYLDETLGERCPLVENIPFADVTAALAKFGNPRDPDHWLPELAYHKVPLHPFVAEVLEHMTKADVEAELALDWRSMPCLLEAERQICQAWGMNPAEHKQLLLQALSLADTQPVPEAA